MNQPQCLSTTIIYVPYVELLFMFSYRFLSFQFHDVFFSPPRLLDKRKYPTVFPLVQYANVGVSLLSIAMITINRSVDLSCSFFIVSCINCIEPWRGKVWPPALASLIIITFSFCNGAAAHSAKCATVTLYGTKTWVGNNYYSTRVAITGSCLCTTTV